MLSAVCARLARSAADAVAFDDILGRIDWDRVGSAVRAVRLPEHDYSALSSMLLKACRRWVIDDVAPAKRIIGVETRFLATIPEREDLAATRLGKSTKADELSIPPGVRVFKLFSDLIIESVDNWTKRTLTTVVDWKTTGSLDQRWRDRHLHSWQAKLSCWAIRADRFIFRGIQRDGRCAEVKIDWPWENEAGETVFGDGDAESYVRQAFGLRDSLRNSPSWPQHTHSCSAFGRTCEHFDRCQLRNDAPRGSVSSGPFSYSTIEEFLLCPERYRLSRILATPDEDQGGAFGTAFHRGIADIYEQLREN